MCQVPDERPKEDIIFAEATEFQTAGMDIKRKEQLPQASILALCRVTACQNVGRSRRTWAAKAATHNLDCRDAIKARGSAALDCASSKLQQLRRIHWSAADSDQCHHL